MTNTHHPSCKCIGIIGLGYVGLPLAVAFGSKQRVIGFDINKDRVESLRHEIDITNEVSTNEIREAVHLTFSSSPQSLEKCDTIIVTVPTPVDRHNRPNLSMLHEASKLVGEHLQPGNTVIFESTVYPGATEEECAPIIEKISGLKLNESYFLGYSPERINPGDKHHRLTTIAKVTSGSNKIAAEFVDNLYRSVIEAGTYLATNIKTAEAAKVIENIQRDVNIALVNDLAVLFDRLELDTHEVLKAAETKWNFLPFKPGLVGGHCIGVDPYYLMHKAEELGHHPKMVTAGRRINDGMSTYIVNKLIKRMCLQGIAVRDAQILILGFTFKENCPDIRNTKVIDLYKELIDFGSRVDIYDPWVPNEVAREEYAVELLQEIKPGIYDALILAVAHDDFRNLDTHEIEKYCKENSVIFDLKAILPKSKTTLRL